MKTRLWELTRRQLPNCQRSGNYPLFREVGIVDKCEIQWREQANARFQNSRVSKSDLAIYRSLSIDSHHVSRLYSVRQNAMSVITFHRSIALCSCHLRCRPTRDEFSEPVQRIGKSVIYSCKAKSEVRRLVEAIPRCEQDALFCGGLAKGAAVLSA